MKKHYHTDKSVIDHHQQAILNVDIITVVSRVGRRKIGYYSFTKAQWEHATRSSGNPLYGQTQFIKSKANVEGPGGECQGNRIIDSQVRAVNAVLKRIKK